jgi:hypothetical protein
LAPTTKEGVKSCHRKLNTTAITTPELHPRLASPIVSATLEAKRPITMLFMAQVRRGPIPTFTIPVLLVSTVKAILAKATFRAIRGASYDRQTD